jgi:ATP-binding protein involved in chromosome partitioning
MATRNVVAVASGKRGVGKTTVAVGLALGLAKQGQSVGLLDADLYGPDVPRMFGLTRTTDASSLTVWATAKNNRAPRPVERYGVKLWSAQFLVSEGQPLALHASLAGLLLNRALGDLDWGDLAWLVVDLPPGTADVQQHLARELGLSGAVVVVTPQDVAHLDAKKVLTLLAQANVPVLGGVENMAALPGMRRHHRAVPSDTIRTHHLGNRRLAPRERPVHGAVGASRRGRQPSSRC